MLAVNHLFAVAVKQAGSDRPKLQLEKEAAAAKIKVVAVRAKDPVKDQVVDMENQVVNRGLLLPAINTKEALRVPGVSVKGQESAFEEVKLVQLRRAVGTVEVSKLPKLGEPGW